MQIIPRLDAGGAELSAIEISEAVVRAGGRSLVLTEGGRMSDRIGDAGGELVPFPAGTKNPLRMLANARAITALIADKQVDLVHARSRAPAWSGLIAARQARVPFVTTYHGAYREANAVKRAYNRVMARGDVVIANSQFTADLIAARYGTPGQRVQVIHRGIDERLFDPARISSEAIARVRADWGVSPGRPIVLLGARLTAWKGQGVLVDAMAELKRRGALGAAVAVLAGDAQGRDGYVESLRRQIAVGGLSDHVRIVGHVSDMATAFRAARVAVVASTEPEAFGRSTIEAQAMAVPVIATAIGAPRETVIAAPEARSDEITGWLVPPDDATALADALATALALDDRALAAIGARARAHVLARFTLRAMKRATLQVYDRLLRTRLVETFDAAG